MQALDHVLSNCVCMFVFVLYVACGFNKMSKHLSSEDVLGLLGLEAAQSLHKRRVLFFGQSCILPNSDEGSNLLSPRSVCRSSTASILDFSRSTPAKKSNDAD